MSQPSAILLVRRPPNRCRPKEGPMATKTNLLRHHILAMLNGSTTTVTEDLDALAQCVAHIRNRTIIGDIARECGLTLAGFLTNDALEVYYDIRRGRHDMGYFSKGWEDP